MFFKSGRNPGYNIGQSKNGMKIPDSFKSTGQVWEAAHNFFLTGTTVSHHPHKVAGILNF